MNNGINAYRAAAIHSVARTDRNEAARTAKAEPPAPKAAEVSNARVAAGADLSPAEQQMIHRYFPPTADQSLRSYGPNHSAKTLDPSSIGRHLDIQG